MSHKNNGNVLYQLQKIMQKKNPRVKRTKQNRLMLVSNCAVHFMKKLRFIKNQEVSRLLSSILGVKLLTSDIPIHSTIFG